MNDYHRNKIEVIAGASIRANRDPADVKKKFPLITQRPEYEKYFDEYRGKRLAEIANEEPDYDTLNDTEMALRKSIRDRFAQEAPTIAQGLNPDEVPFFIQRHENAKQMAQVDQSMMNEKSMNEMIADDLPFAPQEDDGKVEAVAKDIGRNVVTGAGKAGIKMTALGARAYDATIGKIGENSDYTNKILDVNKNLGQGAVTANSQSEGLPGEWDNRVMNSSESLATSVAGTIFSGGNPTAVSALFGLLEANEAYSEARDKGLNQQAAMWHSIKAGGIEGGVDRLFAGFGLGTTANLTSSLKGVKKTILEDFVQAFGEIPSEMATETLHVLNSLDPEEQTMEAFADRMKETVLNTLLTSGGSMTISRISQNTPKFIDYVHKNTGVAKDKVASIIESAKGLTEKEAEIKIKDELGQEIVKIQQEQPVNLTVEQNKAPLTEEQQAQQEELDRMYNPDNSEYGKENLQETTRQNENINANIENNKGQLDEYTERDNRKNRGWSENSTRSSIAKPSGVQAAIEEIRGGSNIGTDGRVRPYTRGSGSLDGSGLVESIYEPTPYTKEVFEKHNLPAPTFHALKQTEESASFFYDSISNAKKDLGEAGASVYTYDPTDYKDMKLFVAEEGKSGFALKADGDIVSVFNSSEIRGLSTSMLELAIQEGGTKLDCFDTYLPKIYKKHGFVEVNRDTWNEDYSPDDWNKKLFRKFNGGEPDVVYFELKKEADTQTTQNETQNISENTGIKNEAVTQQRTERQLSPLITQDKETNQAQLDEATKRINENPNEADDIIADIKKSPRTLKAVESMILLQKETQLRQEYNSVADGAIKAFDQGNHLEGEKQMAIQQRLSDQMAELEEVSKIAGTEWGRAGQARQRMLNEDFTLTGLTRKARVAKGGEQLNQKELTDLKKIADEYKQKNDQLQKKLDEIDINTANKQVDSVLIDIEQDVKGNRPSSFVIKKAEEIVNNWDKEAEKSRKALQAMNAQMSAGVDPTRLYHLAIIGRSHLGHVGLNFGKWSEAMIADTGDWIKPHLQDIYERSRAIVDKEFAKQKTKQVKNKVLKKGDTLESLTNKIQDKITADKKADITPFVQRLAKLFVAESIENKQKLTREQLVQKVQEVLNVSIPDITSRETMDAISGYGQFKQLSKDEISRELRDLKGQMQQVAKLEDMQNNKAPQKTGVERRTPSAEERRLIKQVNEAKRKGGYNVADPDKQIKSALQSLKTRLQNEITDLERQLESGTKDIKNKTEVILDEEAVELKKQRDSLKEQFNSIFGKKELTDDQRTQRAIDATKRSIAEYEKRIKEENLFPKKKISSVKETPELKAARAMRDSLKEQLREMQLLVRPKKTQEQISNQAYRTRTANRIAELEQRMIDENYTKTPRKELQLEPESTKLKYELEQVKERYAKKEFQWKLKNRSKTEKIISGTGEVLNTGRAIMTSFDFSAVFRQGGFIVFSHPARSLRSMKSMFKAFASKEKAYSVMEEIKNRDNYPLYKQAGLFLSQTDNSLSAMEEAYMSRHAEKIPGVAASERAYITFLNKLRADSFDAMISGLGKYGTVTSVEAKAIANYINEATGRGKVGISDKAAVGLNTVFFAPRLVASRFNILFGRPIWQLSGGSARTRALVASEYARYIAALGVIYALAASSAEDDEERKKMFEWDPRSSDFGKIKIGNTRIDPLSGLSQVIVLTARSITGQRKSLRTGDISSLVGDKVKWGHDDLVDVGQKFLRSKLSPAAGSIISLRTGENVIGQKMTPLQIGKEMVTPLVMQEIYTTMREQGITKGTALSLLAIFGMGIQTFDVDKQKTEKDK